MLDARGRNIDYVRISVTDRCNLRCVYCMPEEGICMARHEDILTYDEIRRLCRIFVSLGIKHVKLTGGEPLVRRNVTELVRNLKELSGIETVTLTTNGLLLEAMAEELVQSGIDSVNVSLGTLNEEAYTRMTRVNALSAVQGGIDKILSYGIPVKINCVTIKPQNSDGEERKAALLQIAKLAKNRKLDIRFIELMPIGLGKDYDFIREEEIKGLLTEQFGMLQPCGERLGSGPSHYYSLEGFCGRIGFISAMSHRFCETCNRIRLTAKGYLKTCLQYHIGVDVRALLRDQTIEDDEVAKVIRRAINEKPEGHHFSESGIRNEERDCMSQIGG
jgi:GTP 3',8-cyclase